MQAPSTDDLTGVDAPAHLAALRAIAPASWLDAIDGWMVTARPEALRVLRDPTTFTVDDERFSTSVVVGRSMLSTDGAEHLRHRAPFSDPFSASATANRSDRITTFASELIDGLDEVDQTELCSQLAAPLAVRVIIDALGLVDVDEAALLGWYRAIVAGVDRVSAGDSVEFVTEQALTQLRTAVSAASTPQSMLGRASELLSGDEVFSNTAVLLFGAIETNEGMTANALWYLLSEPELIDRIRSERSCVPDLVDESLRVQPAAAVVDRYATTGVKIGTADIQAGDLVRVSLTAANRDPAHFPDPDRFDIDRHNLRQHLAFVRGPHVCLGLHLARAQTVAAINALLDRFDSIELDTALSAAPSGFLFRKPKSLWIA